jgi:hypothetical protein
MVKRGSELASICGYQGIVSVKKRKFMRDRHKGALIGIRKYPLLQSGTGISITSCRFHDALALPMFSKRPSPAWVMWAAI